MEFYGGYNLQEKQKFGLAISPTQEVSGKLKL
jgi:hypothetical protein